MRFYVLNRLAAEQRDMEKFETPHIHISITDPEREFANLVDNPSRIGTCKVKFDDIDTNVDNINKRLPKYFDEEKAGKIIDFVDKKLIYNTVNAIICQCDAGISRSSAVAGALSILLNGNKSDNWIFKYYRPNMLVYSTLLRVMLERGKL